MIIKFGEIFVEDSRKFKTNSATLINSEYVPDLDLVKFAAEKAIKNWNSGKRISKSLALEILLYYAATRQIKDAIKLGVKDGLNRVVAVVLDEGEFSKLGFRELEFTPNYNLEKIRTQYDITDEELEITGTEKVPMLIRERIALFSVFRE